MDELERFRALLRIPTVSGPEAEGSDRAAFDRFRTELATGYPRLHAAAEVETVRGRTLLLRWPGRDARLAPVVLMAHQDVVDPGDETAWAHPPFAAELVGDGPEQAVWGRGAADDKGALVALLEAAERLVGEGFAPRRDVWFVFGHDEETFGGGAAAAAELLAGRGVRPAFVLDEGGAIVPSIFPGVDAELAAVGLAEKGVATIRLAVREPGGHASTPPRRSAIGRLARAIVRIDARPFSARMTPAVRGMFAAAGRGGHGFLPWLYRNAAWTAPVLMAALRRTPEGDAMTRTTRIATVVRGGHASNAIPETAEALVNVRILPGETVAGAAAHLRAAVADPLVTVEVLQSSEPSPVSPASGLGWELIGAALAEVHPGVVLVPYTQNGATDSRHFTGIADAVYRFTPFRLSPEERAALHAVDERIRVASWRDGIEWYAALLRRL